MVQIERVCFYVDDSLRWRDWFARILGFHPVASDRHNHTQTEVVKQGTIEVQLSSPLSAKSPVAAFLDRHPPGVADLVFRVGNLEAIVDRALALGAKLLSPITASGSLKRCRISALGSLSHTLIENHDAVSVKPSSSPIYRAIDHAVLNVPAGGLKTAIAWYQSVFGFQPQQQFTIATDRSSLHSQVLVHPDTGTTLPVNEPTSETSQIQEFLDANRGAGVQHIALRTDNILATVDRLRRSGLALISVPKTYYDRLCKRELNLSPAELDAIASRQILVDRRPTSPAILLQTFTQPIFAEPTFFFEIVERRSRWIGGQLQAAEGFGEGNFRALFEAVEREQIKRGNLK